MTESIIVALALGVLLVVREWQWRRRVLEDVAEAYDAGFAAGMFDLSDEHPELPTAEELNYDITDVHGEDAPDRYPN